MGRNRRANQRVKLPFRQIQTKLWPLTLLVVIFPVFCVSLLAQSSILCSGELVAFEEYQPIAYPELVRRGGAIENLNYELIIKPDGKFEYNVLDSGHGIASSIFREAIQDSFLGWRFAKNTNGIIRLKLNVIFELSGAVGMYDAKVKNIITFNQNTITIKVVAARIIPIVGLNAWTPTDCTHRDGVRNGKRNAWIPTDFVFRIFHDVFDYCSWPKQCLVFWRPCFL
jgi:hypothetical protein